MRPAVFIVHRDDGLLRAMVRFLAVHGWAARTAERIDALRAELAAAPRPAVLVVDEDDAGAGWRERLADVPADVARVVLTWFPSASFPPGVTPLGKPFRAGELLDAISASARAAPGPASVARTPGE